VENLSLLLRDSLERGSALTSKHRLMVSQFYTGFWLNMMVVLLMFVDSLKSSMYFKGVPIARRNERPYDDKTGTVVRSG